jgi:hypothetical protein
MSTNIQLGAIIFDDVNQQIATNITISNPVIGVIPPQAQTYSYQQLGVLLSNSDWINSVSYSAIKLAIINAVKSQIGIINVN